MPADMGGSPRAQPKTSPPGRAGSSGERTIKRSTFTPEQLSVLESAFLVNPLPALAMRHSLAEQLGLTPRTVQVWFQNRRQKVKKQQVAAGGSTSNESSAERDAMLSLGVDSPPGSIGMTRNSSTGSFELLNAEFERLNRSPSSDPYSDCSPSAAGAPRRRYGGGVHAWRRRGSRGSGGGDADEAGGVSLWGGHASDGPMNPMYDFARPFHSLLGAHMDDGDMADMMGASGDATDRATYRQQLMRRLTAVDPSLGSAFAHRAIAAEKSGLLCSLDGTEGEAQGQYADTLDAAANLLLFSAHAAFVSGAARRPGGGVARA